MFGAPPPSEPRPSGRLQASSEPLGGAVGAAVSRRPRAPPAILCSLSAAAADMVGTGRGRHPPPSAGGAAPPGALSGSGERGEGLRPAGGGREGRRAGGGRARVASGVRRGLTGVSLASTPRRDASERRR